MVESSINPVGSVGRYEPAFTNDVDDVIPVSPECMQSSKFAVCPVKWVVKAVDVENVNEIKLCMRVIRRYSCILTLPLRF